MNYVIIAPASLVAATNHLITAVWGESPADLQTLNPLWLDADGGEYAATTTEDLTALLAPVQRPAWDE